MVTVIFEIGSEIWGNPPQKIWRPKSIKISVQFRATLCFDRQNDHEYLRTGIRYHLSENRIENYDHSHTQSPNLMARNRTRGLIHQKINFFGYLYLGAVYLYLAMLLKI